jgi:hypothetical protein
MSVILFRLRFVDIFGKCVMGRVFKNKVVSNEIVIDKIKILFWW